MEKKLINKILLKQMAFLSAIVGLTLGIFTIIPFINNISFFILMVLTAPILLIYMKKLNLIGVLEPKLGAIYGAIIGFVALLGFSVSFVPLATLIGFLYKGSIYLVVNLMFRSGFFVLIMMIFFIALMGALINAFSGLVTMYVYNQIEQLPAENQTDIDIKE